MFLKRTVSIERIDNILETINDRLVDVIYIKYVVRNDILKIVFYIGNVEYSIRDTFFDVDEKIKLYSFKYSKKIDTLNLNIIEEIVKES